MRRPFAAATVTTFLSHHHTDQAAADDFARQLRQQQLPLFQATQDLRPGDRWLARLQQALDGCDGFVVLVGRDGI